MVVNFLQRIVTCQFVLNKDGSITDVAVVKGVDPSLDRGSYQGY